MYRFKITNWEAVLEKEAFMWYTSITQQALIFTSKCVLEGWFVSPLIYKHTSRGEMFHFHQRKEAISFTMVQDGFNQSETHSSSNFNFAGSLLCWHILRCFVETFKKGICSRGLTVKFSLKLFHHHLSLKWHHKLVTPVLYLKHHYKIRLDGKGGGVTWEIYSDL